MRIFRAVKTVFCLSVLGAACLLLPCTAPAATETITYDYYNTRELKKATYGISSYAMHYVYDNSGNRLSQTVVAPSQSIFAHPSPLSFGSVTVGESAGTSVITVTNVGAAPLQISTVTISGTNASQFTKQSDTCTGQTLPSLGTCQVGIVFTPASPAATKTASATITSNAANSPTLNVTLNGTAQCLYAIDPVLSTLPSYGGSGTVGVTAGPGCTWTSASNTSWITITSGASGAGNGTVGYSVAATNTSQQRSGSATIAGKTLTVSQSGASCTGSYSITPGSASIGVAGGTGSISMTTLGACAWSVTNPESWVSVSPMSGSSSGTINYTVQPNTAATGRTANLTVQGLPFVITQGGTADVTNIGIFRTSGAWLRDNNDNWLWDDIPTDLKSTYIAYVAGDLPVTGDWTGDGVTRIGIFRSNGTTGVFRLDSNNDGIKQEPPDDKKYLFTAYAAGDLPVAGDWNNDGIDEIGIFRSNGTSGIFLLDLNGNGVWDGTTIDRKYIFTSYVSGDRPVIGDWTGDGVLKIGVFRINASGQGKWLLDLNGDGVWTTGVDAQYTFGQTGDKPVVGDWAGDGKTRIGVFRNGTFMLDYNGNGVWDNTPTDRSYIFTTLTSGDRPVAGKW